MYGACGSRLSILSANMILGKTVTHSHRNFRVLLSLKPTLKNMRLCML